QGRRQNGKCNSEKDTGVIPGCIYQRKSSIISSFFHIPGHGTVLQQGLLSIPGPGGTILREGWSFIPASSRSSNEGRFFGMQGGRSFTNGYSSKRGRFFGYGKHEGQFCRMYM